jgi:hypothetical protein
MTRALLEELALFLIPFGAFGLYLLLSRRNPLTREAWGEHIPWLAIGGLLIAIGFLIYTGLSAKREQGAFVPPHLENGKLVPGHFQ